MKMKTPKQALNKAYLKQPVIREEIESFKTAFFSFQKSINKEESEEFNKSLLKDFLLSTFYKQHFINVDNTTDLVIHFGKEQHSPIGVIIEAKRPTNKGEMVAQNNLNQKALQQLLWYYLNQRITEKNIQLKQLAITNAYEWFIFDAQEFEKHFAQNKNLIKAYEQFKRKELTGTATDFFYSEVAKPYIEQVKHELEYTYFNIIQYDTNTPDEEWAALYKLLSPEHLLKQPFLNDSNSLDKNFYNELLYIIGLQELPQGGKDIIHRYDAKRRHAATLIEQAIDALPDTITDETIQFETAMELCITWINRILFIKLLEGQLVSYHKDKDTYSLLKNEKIKDFHALDDFFFKVLAIPTKDRKADIATRWKNIPYLNSSLFDATETEREHNLYIKNLNANSELPVFEKTVLKDSQGKTLQKMNIPILEYLFEFLDAYDFSSEGTATIQPDKKNLINASVLGLVFEKINGYKDGSFFTPGAITMYMCKETITQAVIEKFNQAQGWQCTSLNELFNKNLDIKEANNIINSIKICDPAVGSGHFLVSALNQLIAIKSELQILVDEAGKRIKENIHIENDELIITDYEDTLFQYHPKDPNSNRIQKTLFNEKQRLIENCLFGVDINPNSVKICRLRLWIELLKNAYYKPDGELETLPNIDINIKCGNSLISRFDIKDNYINIPATQRQYITQITSKYKEQVFFYKNTTDKKTKQQALAKIAEYQKAFEQISNPTDADYIKWKKAEAKLWALQSEAQFTDKDSMQTWKLMVEHQTKEVTKLENLYEEKRKTLYKNAFEWRFEFPEVLDEQGNFTGFDVVIGNPPYGFRTILSEQEKKFFRETLKIKFSSGDSAEVFIKKTFNLIRDEGFLSFIVPKKSLYGDAWEDTRINYWQKYNLLYILDTGKSFDNVLLEASAFGIKKQTNYITTKISFLAHGQVSEIGCFKRDILFSNNNTLQIYKVQYPKTIIEKIETYKYIEKMVSGKLGLAIGTDFFSDKTTNDKLLKGIDIQPYHIRSNRYLKNKEKLKWEQAKEFLKPKVLTQVIVAHIENPYPHLKITACYDDDGILITNTLMSFELDKSINDKFWLGYLNSKFTSWYAYNFIYARAIRTMHFYDFYIQQIPIPKATEKEQASIIKLVDKILATKKKNPTADTTTLEQEIDQLVYGLYNLTKGEIKIIEK